MKFSVNIFGNFFKKNQGKYFIFSVMDLFLIVMFLILGMPKVYSADKNVDLSANKISVFNSNLENKFRYEVFGFAPYWTIKKLDNVDYSVLTTLAYFGVSVNADGSLDRTDSGYTIMNSSEAQDAFSKAKNAGTRVVLTITNMDNNSIKSFLDNDLGQDKAIRETVDEIKKQGMKGVNVDFEYVGDPGSLYRDKFSEFVYDLTQAVHKEIPDGRVTVSVYAASVRIPKMYDVASLGKNADGVFMMAYDFATTGADVSMPTAPLYGYKEGTYWYDVSTAVEDFLKEMPAEKLILGVPWYGYNYMVQQPGVKSSIRPSSWRGVNTAQVYSTATREITAERDDISQILTGWDDVGKVGWKAYYVPASRTWRMIFIEDTKSLGLKYDFVKDKKLAGIGMWALGFDDGTQELWGQLRDCFSGTKNLVMRKDN